jgi:hypothetical protein
MGRRGKRAPTPAQAEASVRRLRKRLGDVAAIDFFGASGRDGVERLLDAIDSVLRPSAPDPEPGAPPAPAGVRGRTWVTRRGVHIDRIGSAWLIRRFIDPEARFRFVPGDEPPSPGQLRFDMFEAEFTHEGDQCTFEVLTRRFGLRDAALARIGEIVHDIDLKDSRFGHAETAGLDHLISGIAMRHKDDEDRLRDGGAAFEGLYEFFKRKR